MDLAFSVHFSRSSLEGIVGAAGTIPSISAAQLAAFINHVRTYNVVTWTHACAYIIKILTSISCLLFSYYSYSFICLLFSKLFRYNWRRPTHNALHSPSNIHSCPSTSYISAIAMFYGLYLVYLCVSHVVCLCSYMQA